MITAFQYFGTKQHTPEQDAAARDLLERRNALRAEWMQDTGEACPVDPDTGTEVSGSKGGAGDGGFRLQTATTGRGKSSHKILDPEKGAGVDDFDPGDKLDTWLDQFEDGHGGNSKLEQHGLYRERPQDTPGWCHLQTVPASKRTYIP